MKTIGRILIIAVVFSVIAGLMIMGVNASGTNASGFDGNPQFRPQGGFGEPSFQQDGNPLPEGERERELGGALGLIFGAIGNMLIIGFLVAAIVFPKSIAKKKKKAVAYL